jgi:predicted DNA-binding protein YlxM (UPF0122 family)
MFEKNMKISYLLDIYGSLLDEHIASVMKSYYDDDLSLAEIASEEGISRQGVRHLIKKGEEKLSFFEDKLKLATLYSSIDSATDELLEIRASLLSGADTSEIADKISSVIEIISKGNQDVR